MCKKNIKKIYPYINYFYFWYAEIRLKVIEYLEIEPKYFDIRHLYNEQYRQILDHQFIELYNKLKKELPNEKFPISTNFRIYYLRLKYRFKFHQTDTSNNFRCPWNKENILTLYEELELYNMTTSSNIQEESEE